ncbi:MAG TPA: glycerol kinase GlpK [Candidatus Scybalocola faecigallinarum]|uniref:ATP:glycerol 3-phosphotransferase n=1 Tax=Candidatus Scybalocola faecigallinarum TaxID=2840941 RepID=A0A9D1F2R7_9FIRM|nr:glycerol kinase GlpK [Candidatus Scybalocola faecigallinarum]
MSGKYIIGIDQSTQGTKGMLFDEKGAIAARKDIPHRQIVDGNGWVSHDAMEIYHNTIAVVKALLEENDIDKNAIIGVGISNQRETSLIWDKTTGKPLDYAIVWQCSRAVDICAKAEAAGMADPVYKKTGLKLSPYFPASKFAWLLENVEGAKDAAARHEVCFGTIDTWLIYCLTGGKSYKTDYSNASRTQLFNIFDLKWDEEICAAFGIDPKDLAQVCFSDSCFGETDFEGLLDTPVPIHGVLGDSHGALLGQGCIHPGMIKTTYGTGSSIMMNIGQKPILSTHGVVTSLAWGLNGKVEYVLEGNINYTGAVITWLKDDVQLIQNPGETGEWCQKAHSDDHLYFIPAFTGLGAPYWDSEAQGMLTGITRTTGKAEIIRACIECIAYQITDVITAMSQDAGIPVQELRVDGGPTKNPYLMQFQSDILNAHVLVPDSEALSCMGAAYAAGFGLGVYDTDIFDLLKRKKYEAKMEESVRQDKYNGWKQAVQKVLTH